MEVWLLARPSTIDLNFQAQTREPSLLSPQRVAMRELAHGCVMRDTALGEGGVTGPNFPENLVQSQRSMWDLTAKRQLAFGLEEPSQLSKFS